MNATYIKYPESAERQNMTYTVPQHIHNKRKRLYRPKRDTETRQEREKLLLLLNSNAEAPIMSLIVVQDIIKP